MRPYAWLFEQRLEQLRGSLCLRAPQSLLASQRARASTTVLQGDVRIAAIRKTLTQMGLERSRVQALFHERFIQACATHLFSDDVVSMRDVMKRYSWTDTKQSTLILTPRRFGKTTSIAMFCGAYILCVPRSEVCIFSTGKRASTKLLELISTLVKRTPGGAERVCKQNQEELWITGKTPDDVRKLSSYPSAISTLRGVGGDVLVLEEAAFIEMELFLQVVVPLLQMKQTSLLAISTPQESGNFYSELFNLRTPQGDLYFSQVKIGLACRACIKAGTAETCTHPASADYTPPWQSEGSDLLMKSLYGARTDLLTRETKGIVTANNDSAFEHALVDAMFERGIRVGPEPVRLILTACDPNGGGSSAMALVSLAMVRGQMAVLAVDAATVRGFDEIRQALLKHVTALLRAHASAVLWFAPENNLGSEASHMAAMLRKISRCHCLTEPGKSNVQGVRTTQLTKKLYVGELERHMRCESIGIAQGCLASRATLEALKSQMKQYKKIINHSARGASSVSYSGKGGGANDDLAVAIGLGAYWLTQKIMGLA